jgi:hypothetical protein
VEADITELKRQRSNLRAKIQSALKAHQELLSFDLEEEARSQARPEAPPPPPVPGRGEKK